MVKFIILCTVFFLLYLGFSFVGQYDIPVNLLASGYQITTTLFVLVITFLITQLLLMIVLKCIFSIITLPSIMRQQWQQRKQNKITQRLIDSLAYLLIDKKIKAIKNIYNIAPELSAHNKEIANLIMAEAEMDRQKAIQYYNTLTDNKYYGMFAAKKLAEIFYHNKQYDQAENFAIRAFNQNDTDAVLMLLIIRIYAKLGQWSKLILIVSKLQRTDRYNIDIYVNEIASYYYAAAKHYLEQEQDNEAQKYLELALEFEPSYIEALHLLIEILNNTNQSSAILKLLKSAFSSNPCFEIAKIYADSSNNAPEEIYTTLASISTPIKHPTVFLAIAAYLGLYDKISQLKESKFLA
ncbi:MAG: heme biosynthesis HemY N-terminal domain-containing protein [Rickettsiaceae bacterium]